MARRALGFVARAVPGRRATRVRAVKSRTRCMGAPGKRVAEMACFGQRNSRREMAGYRYLINDENRVRTGLAPAGTAQSSAFLSSGGVTIVVAMTMITTAA